MKRLLQKSEVLLETAHLKPSHPLAAQLEALPTGLTSQ